MLHILILMYLLATEITIRSINKTVDIKTIPLLKKGATFTQKVLPASIATPNLYLFCTFDDLNAIHIVCQFMYFGKHELHCLRITRNLIGRAFLESKGFGGPLFIYPLFIF